MKNLDEYYYIEMVQKRNEDWQCRTPAEHRLYWSTFYGWMAGQTQAPRRIRQGWIALGRFLGVLQSRWPKRVPSAKRAGEEESPAHPLISAKAART